MTSYATKSRTFGSTNYIDFIMRKILTLSSLCLFSSLVFGQGISFKVSNDLEFRNGKGDVITNALTGGFNQPQLYAVDINNDGKSDLFVFDRSGSKVLCLIKQTDDSYKHQPEYDNIFPLFADWVVFKDFDGDGKPDLWFKNEAYNGSVSLYNNVTQPGDKYVHFDT
ncbi:MAG: hypothetical protein ACI8ZN_000071, partial [Bacteroidia bacterium]